MSNNVNNKIQIEKFPVLVSQFENIEASGGVYRREVSHSEQNGHIAWQRIAFGPVDERSIRRFGNLHISLESSFYLFDVFHLCVFCCR